MLIELGCLSLKFPTCHEATMSRRQFLGSTSQRVSKDFRLKVVNDRRVIVASWQVVVSPFGLWPSGHCVHVIVGGCCNFSARQSLQKSNIFRAGSTER